MALPLPLSRFSLALAGVLLLGSGSGWSQATSADQRGLQGQPMLEALMRLTPAQRSDYLQALRALEENRSRERAAQLDQAQRCLAPVTAEPAVRNCWQVLARAQQQLRRQQMQQQQALSQRFGLPAPRRLERHNGERRPATWPQPRQPETLLPDGGS